MGIGISLVLMAVGAILTWGVTDSSAAIDVAAVGVVLMVVGLIGLGLTLAFWSTFSPFAQAAPFRRTTSSVPRFEDEVVVARAPRTVVVREEPRTIVRQEEAPRERTVVVTETDDR